MAKKSKASSNDIAAVEELMQDLETRLRRLNSKAQSDVSDGADITKRVWEEMERHPLTTLALAAAAGYVIGLIGRQDARE